MNKCVQSILVKEIIKSLPIKTNFQTLSKARKSMAKFELVDVRFILL